MSAIGSTTPPAARPWSCPFCPLLCDTFGVEADRGGSSLALTGSDCGRARAALAQFGASASTAQPRLEGRACELDAAIAAAARLLAASRQPLFGGLGTDVAGARALYALACQTGAICDPAQGAALMHGLRPLQDRGAFTTTLAEVRTRADLIVCVGGLPTEQHPEFFRRCGVGEEAGADPQVVVLGATDAALALAAQSVRARVGWLPLAGDLFDTVALLAALVAGRGVRTEGGPALGLAALAARLQAARYAVIVYEPARLPAQGGLIVEAVHRIVGTLNRSTRAAALPLGGGDGASTVNQVFTWLSGLPLRSRAGPAGLEHEPLRFDAQRLLADGAVDLLLWVSSFGAEPAPPSVRMPCIVLGHPGMAPAGETAQAGDSVFIPVSTPGIGSAGHVFRTDGSVLMPLRPVYDDERLPSVSEVVKRLTHAVRALHGVAR